jgi:hypothetical protein
MPDFIAVGPPRTATTWLQRVLEGRVTLPSGTKETDYFGGNYDLGPQWYLAHFRHGPAGRPVGEICPTYFDSPLARDRIARDIPRCRIVCTLRDPVERMHSHYRLLRHEGLAGRAVTFEQALARHRGWNGPGNLLESSHYATHLRGWLLAFGAGNVLTLIHDDLEAEPQGYLDRVCAFIGTGRIDLRGTGAGRTRVNLVERAPRSRRMAARARKIKFGLIRGRRYRTLKLLRPLWDLCAGGGEAFPPLGAETETSLRAELRPEIEALELLLNRDLSRWKHGGAAGKSAGAARFAG